MCCAHGGPFPSKKSVVFACFLIKNGGIPLFLRNMFASKQATCCTLPRRRSGGRSVRSAPTMVDRAIPVDGGRRAGGYALPVDGERHAGGGERAGEDTSPCGWAIGSACEESRHRRSAAPSSRPKSLFKIFLRMSWRRIFRPDCVKNPCHPSGCLRIFALQGKKSTRQSIHVEILNRLLEPPFGAVGLETCLWAPPSAREPGGETP